MTDIYSIEQQSFRKWEGLRHTKCARDNLVDVRIPRTLTSSRKIINYYLIINLIKPTQGSSERFEGYIKN